MFRKFYSSLFELHNNFYEFKYARLGGKIGFSYGIVHTIINRDINSNIILVPLFTSCCGVITTTPLVLPILGLVMGDIIGKKIGKLAAEIALGERLEPL